MTTDDSYPSVQLLGSFAIRRWDRPFPLPKAGTTTEVLAYLLTCPGKDIRRESLANLFWETAEFERARGALNTAIWRINRVLRALKGVQLVAKPTTIRLEADRHVVIDTRRLDDTVHLAVDALSNEVELAADLRGRLQAAVAGHVGPFLDGSSSTWAIVEREKFFNLFMRGLAILMRDCAVRHDYEGALEVGRRVLSADPFREQVQCEVMWLYVLTGQRARALRQYQEYELLLKRELGIRPMPETRILHDHIQSGLDGDLRPSARPAIDQPTSLVPAQTPLDTLFAAIDQSRRSLYDALHRRPG